MISGGVVAAVLPMSCALNPNNKIVELKKRLLDKHKLLGCFSNPDELFYNTTATVVTCIMIFQAHVPHPKNYKTFAWVDADIEFENVGWASDTLKILNGCKDVVQLFSHCTDMEKDGTNLNLFNGFGFSFSKGKKYTTRGMDYWHPGYAWAMTRKAYEKLGGLYDKGVLGSGDNVMALAFINKCRCMTNENYHKDYNNSILEYQKKAKGLRLGYVPGVIRHHFHGSKKNRRYTERWQVLIKHKYSPEEHLTYDKKGILVPTKNMSDSFAEDIMNYFRERKEDD
jgi:hypothetical protein